MGAAFGQGKERSKGPRVAVEVAVERDFQCSGHHWPSSMRSRSPGDFFSRPAKGGVVQLCATPAQQDGRDVLRQRSWVKSDRWERS
jgi:hypothetical protein